MFLEFLIACPTLHMKANHFIGSFIRLPSSPEGDQEASDEGTIDLDRQSIFGTAIESVDI